MIAGKPSVLTVDDDPVSLQFLITALQQLGAEAFAAASCAAALAAAGGRHFDLLLIDHCLPDGDGPALLAALRGRGVHAPAVATSAELDARRRSVLGAAGFAAVLAKPARVDDIRACVGGFIDLHVAADAVAGPAQTAAAAEPLLDDVQALAAIGGDADGLAALRTLLAGELLGVEQAAAAAALEPSLWRDRLHRLRASCGFCGAVALGASSRRLQQALAQDPSHADAAFAQFLRSCAATREALAASARLRPRR
jgi:CheY-like chemotaxis protein